MDKFVFVPMMFFAIACFSGLRGAILSFLFDKYLRDNHFEKWKYLTSSSFFGPGGANSFRGLPFLYNNDDLGDKTVLLYKIKIRHSLVYAVTAGIAMAVTGLIITFLFPMPPS